MPRTPLPITNGYYLSDSLPLSAQECTNWYVNIPQTQALSAESLFGTPGLKVLAAGLGGRQVNRGSHKLNTIPYFVNGNVLYRLNRVYSSGAESFNAEAIGEIEGTGRVWLSDNGTQLCILVPGGKGYIFTADPDTLEEITDEDFRANGDPQAVVYIDGYFVFTTDSKKFIVSALNDGLDYNALDFGTAEADPDDIVAPIVLNNQLFIGGSETIEAFQNIGGSEFPFQRTGLYIQKGITMPFAAVNASNTFIFVGSGENEGAAVWELNGNSVQKISTNSIDSLIQDVDPFNLGDSFAWSYAQKGAYFVCFTLPHTTIVYDTVTGRWHERKSHLVDYIDGSQDTRCRVNSVVTAYGRFLVGDSQDGRIGDMSTDYLTEYDNNIIRVVATQPFENTGNSFLVPYLELVMESGTGNDEVADPQIRMSRSTDGGKTWGDERSRNIGRVGEYDRRTIWRRNGRASRFECFRFTMSDACKPVILQLVADITTG